jgi:hypothetical protein
MDKFEVTKRADRRYGRPRCSMKKEQAKVA